MSERNSPSSWRRLPRTTRIIIVALISAAALYLVYELIRSVSNYNRYMEHTKELPHHP